LLVVGLSPRLAKKRSRSRERERERERESRRGEEQGQKKRRVSWQRGPHTKDSYQFSLSLLLSSPIYEFIIFYNF
jgi:hypothetical protein